MADGIRGGSSSAGKLAVGFSRTRQKSANGVVPPGNTRKFYCLEYLVKRSSRIMHHDLKDIKLLIVHNFRSAR